MPGLEESIESDKRHKDAYKKILSNCDVAIWVLSAINRGIASDQTIIRDIIGETNNELLSRLVIGVNKIDLIHPNNWDKKHNLPSEEQEIHLRERLSDIEHKLKNYIPGLTSKRIVGYSAFYSFRLYELFGAMLEACPDDRAWVLSSRQEIADYKDKVDNSVLKQYRALIQGGE